MLHAHHLAHQFHVHHREVWTWNHNIGSHFGKVFETDPEKKRDQDRKNHNKGSMVGEWKEPAVRLTKNWNKPNFPKRNCWVKTSSKTPTLSKHAKPTSCHVLNTESDASEREKERKRVMCVTRHTKTRVSVVAVKRWRASESQPTKNKL